MKKASLVLLALPVLRANPVRVVLLERKAIRVIPVPLALLAPLVRSGSWVLRVSGASWGRRVRGVNPDLQVLSGLVGRKVTPDLLVPSVRAGQPARKGNPVHKVSGVPSVPSVFVANGARRARRVSTALLVPSAHVGRKVSTANPVWMASPDLTASPVRPVKRGSVAKKASVVRKVSMANPAPQARAVRKVYPEIQVRSGSVAPLAHAVKKVIRVCRAVPVPLVHAALSVRKGNPVHPVLQVPPVLRALPAPSARAGSWVRRANAENPARSVYVGRKATPAHRVHLVLPVREVSPAQWARRANPASLDLRVWPVLPVPSDFVARKAIPARRVIPVSVASPVPSVFAVKRVSTASTAKMAVRVVMAATGLQAVTR